MVEVNPRRFKTTPDPEQIEGTRAIVAHDAFALFDIMGKGKTKQVIDAACCLFEAGAIDTVVVVAPASVCCVWLDQELGEIAKHAWVPSYVERYWKRNKTFGVKAPDDSVLHWIITSYEYLRQGYVRKPGPQLKTLIDALRVARVKGMVVYDESSFIKSAKAQQTKACYELAWIKQKGGRDVARFKKRVILNGTPVANSPLDLYAQMAMLDKRILGFKSFYEFRNRHAKMGGYMGKQVVGFVDIGLVTARIAPHCLRRETKVGILPKIYSRIEVPLSPDTWRVYKEMRDDMVAFLKDQPGEAAITRNAAVKILRLSQITSGFLAGIEQVESDATLFDNPDASDEDRIATAWHLAKAIDANDPDSVVAYDSVKTPPREISREKNDALMDWLEKLFASIGNPRLVIWCRFRAEIARLYESVRLWRPALECELLQGGQNKEERKRAYDLMHGDNKSRDAGILIGQPQAGRFGRDMRRAAYSSYLSQDFNLLTREQTEDRIHRRGQTEQTYYLDVLATGPAGQRTVDHRIAKALLTKQDLAQATCAVWRKLLEEDE